MTLPLIGKSGGLVVVVGDANGLIIAVIAGFFVS